jgi:DNA-binding ferritin-like protein
MSADDINFFFHLREQIKLFHWQTTSFAMHKATDGVIEALDENIDKYVEVYMGKYGRPRVTSKNSTIHVENLSSKAMISLVKEAIRHLQVGLVQKLKPSDTDLMNIRDEMLGELNQLLYLFTLN